MRIGIGYDIHRLIEDKKLILGGVEIPYIKGLLSYTDGDVLLHAIADAILGAMAMGDIGRHFPDTDPQYEGIPSRELIKKVLDIMREKKFTLNNIDTIILAEEPKIYPFKEKMLDELASMLGIGRDRINVKATTNEGVGSIGRGDAIAAQAVVLLEEGGAK
ncbi:MAG: 2-C-methyl-D-erythritol 2,4-cyclodiphosphate synthase [Candidatus Omnitrophota bacterium]|nr:2-C-methyl-D-erythritol 2,4-cyclodiphosphate synthase [Candidatus Omnitrophota bacterium]